MKDFLNREWHLDQVAGNYNINVHLKDIFPTQCIRIGRAHRSVAQHIVDLHNDHLKHKKGNVK